MSRIAVNQRSCKGKMRHRSERAAKLALDGTMKTFAELGLVYYRCQFCGGWHVGHASKGEQKRLKFDRLIRAIEHAQEN